MAGIQVFGARKCFDTQKAERFFRERGIKYQYVDIRKYGLSKGELRSVVQSVGLNPLFDQGSREYSRLNLDRIRDAGMRAEILEKTPTLYRTPIVRSATRATVGYQPQVWEEWLKEE